MSGETAPPKAAQKNEDLAVTPLDILISFLTQLKNASNIASDNVPDAMRTLISQSLELASGMVTYPLAVSSGISKDAQGVFQTVMYADDGAASMRQLLANETEALDFEAINDQQGTSRFRKELASDLLQVQVLKMLIRMSGAQRVLEIGTFTGFAALNMAEALPSDGHLVTMEIQPFFAQFARDFFSRTAQSSKIEVQEGSALELLKQIEKKGESFDFIYVDAFKSDYKDYLKIILDNNILASKGTILFDNTIFKGTAYMEDYPIARFARRGPAVRKFNQILQNETRVEQVILPICDGVTIVRRTGE